MRLGLSHLVLHDTNGLYGLYPFAQAARRVGLQAVFGAELVHRGRRLSLVAQDERGYASLCALLSAFHGVGAEVLTIEYDPNRSARIALVEYTDGEKRYIVAPEGLQVGQKIMSGEKAAPEVGNALFLADIPLGTMIHNIELHPGRGANIARSAGASAQLKARDGKYAIIALPSGEVRMILTTCLATIGSVGNSEHNQQVSGKAGRSRWLGRRPRVRGVVMNPVDHPMGGGEGRNAGGHPRSRNGIPAKGYKTRDKQKHSSKYIIERRKK